MICPLCGSDELLIPRAQGRDMLALARLKRPVECHPCGHIFLGNAVAVLGWQLNACVEILSEIQLPRLRIPRVKIRATGVVGQTLQTLVGPSTALVRYDPLASPGAGKTYQLPDRSNR